MTKIWENIKDCVFICFILAILTIWLWLPPVWANLAYGDWTCAYKECVVIKGDEK